jgi:hypothetical protein
MVDHSLKNQEINTQPTQDMFEISNGNWTAKLIRHNVTLN